MPIDWSGASILFEPELHETVIARGSIQPRSEILDFMFLQFVKQRHENIAGRIFGIPLIIQVLTAEAKHQVGISLIEHTYPALVFVFSKACYDLFVGQWINLELRSQN